MRNWLAFISITLLAAACGSDSKNPAPTTTCGTGTVLSGTMCVPDGTGSGNNVTCGTGTHLSGTMCIPDGGGTPGAPTITAITPDSSGWTGYVLFQITGTNLAGVDPSMVHVFFGATTDPYCEAAVGAVDDTTLAGEVPPLCGGADLTTTVTLVTDQGMATTPFRYLALFAADGDNFELTTQTGGLLWAIDPYAALSAPWAQLSDGTNNFNVDGLAFDSTGVLWGTTTGDSPGDVAANGNAQLVTISLADGTVTAIGDLVDAGTGTYYVTDIKFSGTTLYGWAYNTTANTDGLVTIDPTTGVVTPVGTPATTTYGVAGLAVDAGGVLWATTTGASSGDTNLTAATGLLTNVDTTTGALTTMQTLDYTDSAGNPMGAPIDAMDYVGTNLVAVVSNTIYGQTVGAKIYGTTLAVINPMSATGNIGVAFELPAQNGMQSTVSGIAFAPAAATVAARVHHSPLTWTKLAGTHLISH